jgi:hypothetical protein
MRLRQVDSRLAFGSGATPEISLRAFHDGFGDAISCRHYGREFVAAGGGTV